MSHLEPSSLQFAANFVDAITIRPFYADLKRLRQQSARFGALPGQHEAEAEAEAADAADAA